jgi:pyrroline-5-carboxylate reductase
VDERRLRELGERYGIETPKSNRDCVSSSDIIVLAVKPRNMWGLLAEIADMDFGGKLVISVAAGLTIGKIERLLGDGVRVVRVMPNTPALAGEGMSVWARGMYATDDDAGYVRVILESLGKEMEVGEDLIDGATAISGSGPAYLFHLAEVMQEMGKRFGFTDAQALRLVIQTIIGAGRLLEETGESPETLRSKVTSPGGTTEAALKVLGTGKVKETYMAAIEAARARAAELAGEKN